MQFPIWRGPEDFLEVVSFELGLNGGQGLDVELLESSRVVETAGTEETSGV